MGVGMRVGILLLCAALASAQTLSINRPPASARRFRSAAVDSYIDTMLPKFSDPDIAVLFANCLPNTLDTTIGSHNDTDTFVITGDIDAMWLRDSTNQVLPYMPFAKADASLSKLLCGVVQRQAYSILLYPFANAYNFNNSGAGHQDDQTTPKMHPGVFEAKYELDSLAAFLKLSSSYFKATGDVQCFHMNEGRWVKAVRTVLAVVEVQQRGTDEDQPPAYTFQRQTAVATDTLAQGGVGVTARRCGLSKGAFRPSDDASTFPFHIPSNAMLVVELRNVTAVIAAVEPEDTQLVAHTLALADQINKALQTHAIVKRADGSFVFAYEVDGFGSSYLMDDANIPSLLSLPYLGFMSTDTELYQATRRMVLSDANPYYFEGSAGEGIGGPHIGPGYIWPMSLVMRAMTTDDEDEINEMLQLLVQSSAGTGFLHESYHKDNVTDYTRPWFAWVNGLFGELVMKLVEERPWLVLSGDDRRVAPSRTRLRGCPH